jgi:hypothetical protein
LRCRFTPSLIDARAIGARAPGALGAFRDALYFALPIHALADRRSGDRSARAPQLEWIDGDQTIMMIPVEMLNEHSYTEDARGNVRVLPRKWVGELAEEVAIGAIAGGHARPLADLSADQKRAVDVVRAAMAGDEVKVAALLAEEEAAAAPAAPPPKPKRAKLKARYEGPDETGQPTRLAKGALVEGELAERLIDAGHAEEVA